MSQAETERVVTIAVACDNRTEARTVAKAVEAEARRLPATGEQGRPVVRCEIFRTDRDLVAAYDMGEVDAVMVSDDFGISDGGFCAHVAAIRRLKDKVPVAVICHRKSSYFDAVEARADDCLPSCYSAQRLAETVELLVSKVSGPSRFVSSLDCLKIVDGPEVHYVRYCDISVIKWCSGARNKVLVHTMDGAFRWARTMEEAAKELCPKGFVMVSRGAIVNLSAVLEVCPEKSRRISLRMPFVAKPVPVSKAKAKLVGELLAVTGRFAPEDFAASSTVGVMTAAQVARQVRRAADVVRAASHGEPVDAAGFGGFLPGCA